MGSRGCEHRHLVRVRTGASRRRVTQGLEEKQGLPPRSCAYHEQLPQQSPSKTAARCREQLRMVCTDLNRGVLVGKDIELDAVVRQFERYPDSRMHLHAGGALVWDAVPK